MELGTIIGNINCGHKIFYKRPGDEDVTKQPLRAFTVHKCEELEVYQQHKGLKRYFLQHEKKN